MCIGIGFFCLCMSAHVLDSYEKQVGVRKHFTECVLALRFSVQSLHHISGYRRIILSVLYVVCI